MFDSTPHRLALAVCAACLATGGMSSAWAQDGADRFDLHGFGHQSYIQSNGNPYLGADKRGSWDDNFLGLVLTANVNERSKLWAQLEATTGEGTRFTWFFLDYQLNDALRLHAGRVKFPLGLYNETIDAKFLHASAVTPSLYSSAADMVHDAYHGVGADYEQDVGNGHLTWQLYGGNAYDVDPPVDSRDRRMAGARVTYRTPINGLRFMLSGYRTQVELLADHSLVSETRVIGSADYVNDGVDVKAEYAKHSFLGVDSNAYYVQGSYAVSEKWSPYVRLERVNLDKTRSDDPSYYQKTAVVGLSYRLSGNVGFRIEDHFNRGYGLPVATGEVTAGHGKQTWNLLAANINFAF